MQNIISSSYSFFMCAFIFMGTTNLQSMIAEVEANEYFPTLKRLASEAYWKYNDRMPEQKMNDAVQMLLITYAPLHESTIKEVFNNSKFLNDVARIEECRQFIKENKVRGSDVSIFFTGIASGIRYNPRQMVSTNFTEIKKRRINNYAEKTNISPDELAIDIEENDSEEWLYACGNVNGFIFCKITLPALACTWGLITFLTYLKQIYE